MNGRKLVHHGLVHLPVTILSHIIEFVHLSTVVLIFEHLHFATTGRSQVHLTSFLFSGSEV
jgi:hypothetical protein